MYRYYNYIEHPSEPFQHLIIMPPCNTNQNPCFLRYDNKIQCQSGGSDKYCLGKDRQGYEKEMTTKYIPLGYVWYQVKSDNHALNSLEKKEDSMKY